MRQEEEERGLLGEEKRARVGRERDRGKEGKRETKIIDMLIVIVLRLITRLLKGFTQINKNV